MSTLPGKLPGNRGTVPGTQARSIDAGAQALAMDMVPGVKKARRKTSGSETRSERTANPKGDQHPSRRPEASQEGGTLKSLRKVERLEAEAIIVPALRRAAHAEAVRANKTGKLRTINVEDKDGRVTRRLTLKKRAHIEGEVLAGVRPKFSLCRVCGMPVALKPRIPPICNAHLFCASGCGALAGKHAYDVSVLLRRSGAPWRCLRCAVLHSHAIATPESRAARSRASARAYQALDHERRREMCRKGQAAALARMTEAELRERGRKAGASARATILATTTAEERRERSARASRASAARPPEARIAAAKAANAARNAQMTTEQRAEVGRRAMARLTPEQLRAKALAAWATRRAKARGR